MKITRKNRHHVEGYLSLLAAGAQSSLMKAKEPEVVKSCDRHGIGAEINSYMKAYIKNWLTCFEDTCIKEEGRARRPMTQAEFEMFFNDCMIESQELILGV
jgi:hypothetical protein